MIQLILIYSHRRLTHLSQDFMMDPHDWALSTWLGALAMWFGSPIHITKGLFTIYPSSTIWLTKNLTAYMYTQFWFVYWTKPDLPTWLMHECPEGPLSPIHCCIIYPHNRQLQYICTFFTQVTDLQDIPVCLKLVWSTILHRAAWSNSSHRSSFQFYHDQNCKNFLPIRTNIPPGWPKAPCS